MAKLPRVSIGLLMAAVGLVAADFAIGRVFWDGPHPWLDVAVVTLPMSNVLLLALPRLRSAGPARRFWAGFEAAGWPAVTLCGALAWSHGDSLFWPIELLGRLPMFRDVGESAGAVLAITLAVALYATPQLLAALLGGWLAGRYRIAIERR